METKDQKRLKQCQYKEVPLCTSSAIADMWKNKAKG
jgi:hypothetical protein